MLFPPAAEIYLNGFDLRALAGILSFVSFNVALVDVKFALYKVNLRSLVCSGVQVEAFCDVKNTPLYGCLVTLLSLSIKSKPPVSAI